LEGQYQLLDEESTAGMVWKDSTISWSIGIYRRNGSEGQYQLLVYRNPQEEWFESTVQYQLLGEESTGGMG
jgi:hypothetical protein